MQPHVITPVYSENPSLSNNILHNALNRFINPVTIFTDASKSNEGTGCAYFVPFEEVEGKFKLDNKCSIFTAEAIAIYKALSYIETLEAKEIIILSDSLSVLTALKNTYHFSYKINPYILKIKQITYNITQSGRNVTFVWVKAHIGLKHNEHVDTLAKEACVGNEVVHKICLTDYFNLCQVEARNNWENCWQKYVAISSSNYCKIQPFIPRRFWHHNYNIPRKYVTTINRIRFGHACYPAHLYKIGVLPSQQCAQCDALGNLDHIFFGCVVNKNATDNFIRKLTINCNIMAPFNILNLLSLDSQQIYEAIIGFLVETNVSL